MKLSPPGTQPVETYLRHLNENLKRLPAEHYRKTDHTDTGGTSSYAGKPPVLDEDGHVPASMINSADVAHGGMGGLQGGTTGEYYHLTAAQSAALVDSGDTDIHYHSNAWPIGSVFLSVVSTSPTVLLGFGTWERIAQGKFLVGLSTTDTDFDAIAETGGAKTHTHAVDPAATTSGTPSAATTVQSGAGASVASATHTHSTDIASTTSGSGSNVPPYYVVNMWKRTA